MIIVDDASTKPFKCPKEYNLPVRIRIIRHNQNLGISAARNTGIKESKHEWIAFLDSDDEWSFDKIEKQTQDQNNNSETLFFYTEEKWIRDQKIVNKKKHQKKLQGWIFKDCLKQCFIGASTTLIHKSIFDSIGLFDPSLTVCEDYDFWIRVSLKYKIFLNPQPLITKHGGHGDQLSTQYFAMDYYRLLSLLKIFKAPDINSSQRELLKIQILKKMTLLKKGAEKHNNQELLKKLKSLDNSL